MGWNEIGFVYNFSKIPITSIEIARSQKWWMWEGDELSKAMFDAYGITPIPLSFTDVMTSLKNSEEGRSILKAAKVTGFFAVTDKDYDEVRAITKFAVGETY